MLGEPDFLHQLIPCPKSQGVTATAQAQEVSSCLEVFKVAELSPTCPRMCAGRTCTSPPWQHLA